MIRLFKSKKIIFLIIIVIIVAYVLLQFEVERKKEQCIERTSKMSTDQLLDNFDRWFVTSSDEASIYARELMLKYYSCNIEKEQDETKSNKIYEQAEEFIEMYSKTDEARLYNYDYLKHFKDKNYELFFSNLNFGDLEKLCPDKLPSLCDQDNKKYYSSALDNWCSNICSLLFEYENSEEKLNDLVNIEFKNSKSIWSPVDSLREVIVFRFGGGETVMQMCDSLTNAKNSSICKMIAYRLEMRVNMECSEVADNMNKMLCGAMR